LRLCGESGFSTIITKGRTTRHCEERSLPADTWALQGQAGNLPAHEEDRQGIFDLHSVFLSGVEGWDIQPETT
jgi:hypothetical protein